MNQKCKKCGKCCKFVEFSFSGEVTPQEKEFYIARGFDIFVYATHFIIRVNSICPHLTTDNLCDLHGIAKPYICKQWGMMPESDEWSPYSDGCAFKSDVG